MNNPKEFFNNDINALRAEMHELTKRVIVAEVQLDELVNEHKFKKQVWAIARRELSKLGWVIAGVVLMLLLFKLHYF